MTEFSLIDAYEFTQLFISVWIIKYLISHHIDWGIVTIYTLTILLFAGLKFNIIPYELGSEYDRWLWGTYNVGIYTFIIFIITECSRNKK